MRVKAAIAKIVYFFSFPVLGFYLHNSERTRVIITHQQQVLLQRGWIGAQQWGFPGGGVSRKEDPRSAAAREVYEETGIKIEPQQLRLIAVDRLPHTRRWPQYMVRFYHVALPQKKQPRVIRPLEVMEVRWHPLQSLPKNISNTVHIGLKNDILKPQK